MSGVVPRSYSGSIVRFHDSGEGSNGHTVRRVLLCVDPNSFSTLALSFSSPTARRENYTPDDLDLYHVLLGQPKAHEHEPELVALSYAQLYDKRAGAIEIELKEDKQGFGLTKRRKKRAAAQQMVILLNTLAHNMLMWARGCSV